MDVITIGSVELPPDLQWVDEFDAGSDLVGQDERITITGALVIQASAQQAGRRMTLEGRLDGNVAFATVTRTQVEALRALAAVPGEVYTVTLSDGRTFDAAFRRDNGPAIKATPLRHIDPPLPDDLYVVTISLILV